MFFVELSAVFTTRQVMVVAVPVSGATHRCRITAFAFYCCQIFPTIQTLHEMNQHMVSILPVPGIHISLDNICRTYGGVRRTTGGGGGGASIQRESLSGCRFRFLLLTDCLHKYNPLLEVPSVFSRVYFWKELFHATVENLMSAPRRRAFVSASGACCHRIMTL